MFENTLLASSILAIVCAVILVAAAVVWMKYGKRKKTTGSIKEKAASVVSNDKAENAHEDESNWGEALNNLEKETDDEDTAPDVAENWGDTLAEYENGKDADAETDTEEAAVEETEDVEEE